MVQYIEGICAEYKLERLIDGEGLSQACIHKEAIRTAQQVALTVFKTDGTSKFIQDLLRARGATGKAINDVAGVVRVDLYLQIPFIAGKDCRIIVIKGRKVGVRVGCDC